MANNEYRLTPELLMKAVAGEQNAIAGYERMKNMTNDREHISILDGIIMDEHKHLRRFEELYQRKFGKMPSPPAIEKLPSQSFTDALRLSIITELDTSEFYRDIYLENGGEQIKSLFFEAMEDESEHAGRLNMMYSRELEKRLM